MMWIHHSFKQSNKEVVLNVDTIDSDSSLVPSEQVQATFSYGQLMGQLHEQKRLKNKGAIGSGPKQAVSGEDRAGLSGITIDVLLKEPNTVETVSLEAYVLGVSLAEIPMSFEYEAIKAQMLVARTYILHRLWKNSSSENSDDINLTYDVTDQSIDQVYLPLSEVERYRRDKSKQEDMKKFERALASTENMFIAYEDEPIEAVFFSTSNGYTENSEDYWGDMIPYLRSVSSEWDKDYSPSYVQEQTVTYQKFNEQFGSSTKKPKLEVEERTKTNRIAAITINGQLYSGREVRERLGLASNHFTWKQNDKKEEITFTTYGYGHGVGLSQWGANGMAAEGFSAQEIIEHYYSGVEIQQASKLVNN